MLQISVIYYDANRRKIKEFTTSDAAQAHLLTPSDGFLRFNGDDWKVVQIIKEVDTVKAQCQGEMSIAIHVHLRKITHNDFYLMPRKER